MILSAPPSHSFPILQQNTYYLPQQQDLKQFEGVFQKVGEKDACIQFTVKDGALSGRQLWDDRAYELVRKSAEEFMTKGEEYDLRFFKDETGAVVKVKVGRIEWLKVDKYEPRKIVQLPSAQLKRLEGKYRFQLDENMELKITVKDSHLVLKQLWDNKEIALWPENELDFFSKDQSFPATFIKDAGGKITKLQCFETDLWDKTE